MLTILCDIRKKNVYRFREHHLIGLHWDNYLLIAHYCVCVSLCIHAHLFQVVNSILGCNSQADVLPSPLQWTDLLLLANSILFFFYTHTQMSLHRKSTTFVLAIRTELVISVLLFLPQSTVLLLLLFVLLTVNKLYFLSRARALKHVSSWLILYVWWLKIQFNSQKRPTENYGSCKDYMKFYFSMIDVCDFWLRIKFDSQPCSGSM